MSIAPYLKIIGRGKEGARALDRAQALDLMQQVLEGRVGDLELGGFALAMRIKGESADELASFVEAAQQHTLPLASATPAVLLPSYNGARKLPNFTPLLALLLAREGVPVLVHGPIVDAGRVTSAAIFTALGLPPLASGAEVQARWAAGQPAFMALETLNRPLAQLLAVRQVLGLRNPGHTIAKLLPAVPGGLRVINHTHPEYAISLAQYLRESGANAMLMRGTEGEPVADCRRQPKLDVYLNGVVDAELSVAPQEGVLPGVPALPEAIDAETTAAFITEVLAGRAPLPAPIARQVQGILATLAHLPRLPQA